MALKRSSEIITISGTYENNTGGFTAVDVDLQLNPLDQEVFVVLAIDVDFVGPLPVAVAASGQTQIIKPVAFSTTRPATQLNLGDSNVFAMATQTAVLFGDGASPPAITAYALEESLPSNTPDANLDYIAIIATSDFFVGGTDDTQNISGTDIAFKIWGYRARADAATYAALVQSEVLSS